MSTDKTEQASIQPPRSADLANAEVALKRAAARAREAARRTGTAVVIFENGEIREYSDSADARPVH